VPTIISHGPKTMQSSHLDLCTFDLPSGQILLRTTPSFSQDGDELLLRAGHEGLAEVGDVQHGDKGIVTGAISLPVTWDVQSVEGTEMPDNIDDLENFKGQPPTCFSSSEISSWYEQVPKFVLEPLHLISRSFERGVIGGMSTNDVLMIKGLIDPLEYVQFFLS
jgi:hypothetical protein